MFHSRQGKILVGLLVLALAVVATAVILSRPDPAVAQAPAMPGMDQGMPVPPRPPGGAMMPGMPGGPMMQPMPGYGGGMMGGMMGGMPAIAASGDYVYVVQGNTLYQFSAKTLKLVNKAQLTTAPASPPRYPSEAPGMSPAPQ